MLKYLCHSAGAVAFATSCAIGAASAQTPQSTSATDLPKPNAGSQFTDADLAAAKVFMETQMTAEAREKLLDMAKRDGRKPEELLLAMRAKAKPNNYLGGGSGDLPVPATKGPNIHSGSADISPPPPPRK